MKYLRRSIAGLAIVCLGTSLGGCANLSDARQSIARNQAPDVGPTREKRNEEVARDFDKNRDTAQFEAAASCWQRGDVEGSKMMLTQLLERNPNFRRARFVLADIYLFNGDTQLATEQLRTLVDTNPSDAMAHHALAQVLEAAGKRNEALTHYQKAVELEPKNQVYAISYRSAAGNAPSSAPPTDTIVAQTKPVAARPTKDHPGVALTDLPMPPTASKIKDVGDPRKTDITVTDFHKPDQQTLPTPAAVDDWVRPIDLGSSSADASANHSQEARTAETKSAARADSDTATSRRTQQGAATLLGNEPASGTAVTAGYSAEAAKPVNPQKPQNPLQRAVEALAQGNADGAIDAATAGLMQTPEQKVALYRVLGAAHYRKGEYQAAQTALAQALSLDKTDGLSYFLMGSTQAKLGQPDMAARCFAEATRLDAHLGTQR